MVILLSVNEHGPVRNSNATRRAQRYFALFPARRDPVGQRSGFKDVAAGRIHGNTWHVGERCQRDGALGALGPLYLDVVLVDKDGPLARLRNPAKGRKRRRRLLVLVLVLVLVLKGCSRSQCRYVRLLHRVAKELRVPVCDPLLLRAVWLVVMLWVREVIKVFVALHKASDGRMKAHVLVGEEKAVAYVKFRLFAAVQRVAIHGRNGL